MKKNRNCFNRGHCGRLSKECWITLPSIDKRVSSCKLFDLTCNSQRGPNFWGERFPKEWSLQLESPYLQDLWKYLCFLNKKFQRALTRIYIFVFPTTTWKLGAVFLSFFQKTANFHDFQMTTGHLHAKLSDQILPTIFFCDSNLRDTSKKSSSKTLRVSKNLISKKLEIWEISKVKIQSNSWRYTSLFHPNHSFGPCLVVDKRLV